MKIWCSEEAVVVVAGFFGVCVFQEGSALNLAKHVEEEARDLTGEVFTRFMDSLYERISALVDSSDAAENLGAVRAIDELISVQLGESATKIAKFASFLQKIFESKQDPDTIVAASVALGHLASTGGALTADVVESQVWKRYQSLILVFRRVVLLSRKAQFSLLQEVMKIGGA
jgi:FKBP12-rapamycin complex-associated protein